MNQGSSFDLVADDYLRARSEYPAAMFDQIYETASLGPDAHVLDIGCGSGQASLEFLRRGSDVVALDPATEALDLLAQRCGNPDRIELVNSSFERFQASRQFDLIACAQAFHWLDVETAPAKILELLKPQGHVALFWHFQDVAPESPQADLYLLSAEYFKSFPVLNPPEYGLEFVDAMAAVLTQSEGFEEPSVSEYPWRQSYEPEMFKALFRSASSFAQLDGASKRRINRELDDYLRALPEDPVIDYRTCLIEARAAKT